MNNRYDLNVRDNTQNEVRYDKISNKNEMIEIKLTKLSKMVESNSILVESKCPCPYISMSNTRWAHVCA